jgi:hypothetical protein
MKRNLEKLRLERRSEYPLRIARWWHEHMRERVNASRQLFGKSFYRGDCHCHTIFSDGIGTVAEMDAMKNAAGLDFLFITDHWTVAQKRECVKFQNLWWGQEPVSQFHHMGILDNPRTYKVKKNLHADVAAARKLGKLVFIPHPKGWYPVTRYKQDQEDVLFTLGDEFNMEIINGANQMLDCFDVTDEQSVALWDKLLCAGRRVHAMGNTDAHLPHCIGSVWNGVWCAKLAKDAVIAALGKGRHFVSEAPLIHLEVSSGGRRAGMGQSLRITGGKAKLQYRGADSLGLQVLRVVQDGRTIREIELGRKPLVDGTLVLTVGSRSRYVRIECNAKDWRRAFSNPVYFEAK